MEKQNINQVNAESNHKRPDRDPKMTCNPRLTRRTNEQPKEIVQVAESQQNRAEIPANVEVFNLKRILMNRSTAAKETILNSIIVS